MRARRRRRRPLRAPAPASGSGSSPCCSRWASSASARRLRFRQPVQVCVGALGRSLFSWSLPLNSTQWENTGEDEGKE
ncbi:hypothetical protein JRQ81_010239 [Phrynocephalus forsythii]|uniref:Uncharacterized protein n=1 Tax=Phrynocephalus forsythii TaxID=171643 RepID=A0A9Q0X8R2_9SAUR|nr:hypothetical protein JRQ81_010239 [Phrynocephalus forsythii]